MAEISREVVDDFPVKVQCKGCCREIALYFNSGELDEATCCGYKYALEHGDIFLVIEGVIPAK